MIRVFLVDDHEVVRRGLVELLDSVSDVEVVGEDDDRVGEAFWHEITVPSAHNYCQRCIHA